MICMNCKHWDSSQGCKLGIKPVDKYCNLFLQSDYGQGMEFFNNIFKNYDYKNRNREN